MPYKLAWDLQKDLTQKLREGIIPDTLLLLEHEPVFTIGKNGNRANLLIDEPTLESIGAKIFFVDRGGDITFHGPGQIVGYPILNLKNYRCNIKWYIHHIEDVIIHTLAHFGIKANRINDLVGVWVNNKKICAIGTRVSRWITSHGFALNVNTSLDYFKFIVPCGIKDKGVTSIAEILGYNLSIEEVKDVIAQEFSKVFIPRQ